MKTILIPTDFSDTAMNASTYALSLFGNNDNVYILLHTYLDVYTPPEVTTSIDVAIAEQAHKEMEYELERIKKLTVAKNAVFETVCDYGSLIETIRRIIRERKVDYVVMGTRGAKGISELLIGSNAASAALNLKCPLLIIPDGAEFKGMKKIVYAADYEHLDNVQVLEPMIKLAKDNEVHITVLNILVKGKITDTSQAFEGLKLERYLGEIEMNYNFVEDDDKAHAIEDFLSSHHPDMLVILRRKMGFFENLFHKSLTQQMAFHTHIPLLVLHE
jgi:nucleotide-binding universal stress UspA family protein